MDKKVVFLKLRTIIVLIALTIGCALGYYFNHYSHSSNVNELFTQRQQENATLYRSITTLSQQKAESMTRDYTYWDEMVEFVTSKDASWAEANLDPGLVSFGVSGIWVFGLDNTLVYSVISDEGTAEHNQEFLLNANARSELFNGNKFVNFYSRDGKGDVWEIQGATIHPTNDAERKTSPRGYFYVGRRLNAAYLNQLGSYTSSTVTITSDSQEEINHDRIRQGISVVSQPLKTYKKDTLAYMTFTAELPTIKQLEAEVDREAVLTGFSYATFYIAIAWLIILYSEGLVRRKKETTTTPTN